MLGLRAAEPLIWAYQGDISPGEAMALLTQPAPAPKFQGITQPAIGQLTRLRTWHHEIARLFSSGMRPVEISRITGRNTNWLLTLSNDTAFKELIAFYQGERDLAVLDVTARIGTLALGAMDEIQDRLEEDPKQFTNGELQRLMDSALDRTGHGVQTKVSTVAVTASLDEIKQRVLLAQKGNVQARDSGLDLRPAIEGEARVVAQTEESPGEPGGRDGLREQGGQADSRKVA